MNTEELHHRIQRIFLDEKTRERLLKELEQASGYQREVMKEFLEAYESETLKTLNEKTETIEEQLENARSSLPERKDDIISKEVAMEMLSDLEGIFLSKEKLAKFLTFSDDRLLYNLEKMFQGELKDFFIEIRLQKAAFQKQKQDDLKKSVTEEIFSSKQRSEQLDAFIEEVKSHIKQH